jgi:hypothetical protein
MIFYLVPLAVAGAVTVGVFAGIKIGRMDSKEWLRLKDQRIAIQEQIIATQDKTINTYKAALEGQKWASLGMRRDVKHG